MKTSKIFIRNLFGISERTLDGASIELTGPKGAGKTSVLDAIRYALTNRSDRDYIIRQGADEGEIIIETDTGLHIDRKTRTNKADAVKVRDGSLTHTRPAEFLNQIFTPLQLNPVEFTQMSRQEKNRVILNLVEFAWDTNWIREKFGELPQGVDYSKHILEVLADIQSESGAYYQSRQNINRDIRNNLALIEEIARVIPEGYQAEKWEAFDLSKKYQELNKIQSENSIIARAQTFRDGFNGKMRGFEAERDSMIMGEEKAIAFEREQLTAKIERLRAEIVAAENTIKGLGERLEDKRKVAEAEFQAKVAKLKADNETALQYADLKPTDVAALSVEISTAEAMKKHLNEYARMVSKQADTEKLSEQSAELTRKIELARELPGEILKTAKIPIDGLTVTEGVPLINGLPISNLSDGELLELCVDVSVSKPGQLQIILVDGAERLDTESRHRLYQRCKDKGLQLIATRVTDGTELEVVYLD